MGKTYFSKSYHPLSLTYITKPEKNPGQHFFIMSCTPHTNMLHFILEPMNI